MNMKRSIFSFAAAGAAALLVMSGAQALAQTAGVPGQPAGIARPGQQKFVMAPMALSLADAQQYAVDHNRTLQNASLDIRKAQASKWQAIAAMLPQVKGSVDYSNYCGFQMSFGGQAIAMPPYSTLGLQTSVAFNGAMVVSAQLAEISKKMADITLKKSEKEIKDQVRTLYYTALVSEKTLGLMEDNLKSMEKLHDISVKSVKAGVAEQTDADQLQVQVATMENTVVSLKRSLEMIYNSIRLTLCLSEDTPLVLTQSLDELMNLDTAGKLLAEDFDINNNYNYQLLQQTTDIARKQVALSVLSNSPTLSVYHQYSYKHYFSDEKTMNMTPPNMVGATLSIPIFTSLKASAAHKEAKIAYQKQLNTVADTELALKIQHSQCVYNLSTAIDKYMAQKQSVDVAKRVFDNIGKKFEYGVASSMDVTNAGTSLISTESSYVQSVLDVVNAQIALEELLNK